MRYFVFVPHHVVLAKASKHREWTPDTDLEGSRKPTCSEIELLEGRYFYIVGVDAQRLHFIYINHRHESTCVRCHTAEDRLHIAASVLAHVGWRMDGFGECWIRGVDCQAAGLVELSNSVVQ